MTTKVDLPDGQWAELRDPDSLTGADQDAYFDEHDRLLAAVPVPPPQPDPANPAQMLQSEAKLDNAGWRTLRDYALNLAVTSWSLDLPLPFTAESKRHLSLKTCAALYEAVRPLQRALNGAAEEDEGDGPKPAEPTGTDGSEDSVPDGTESPRQEPAGEPYTTP